MKSQYIIGLAGRIAVVLTGLLCLPALLSDARGQDNQDRDGATVLTRGPIHEAFAQPGDYNPTLGSVVSRQSPPLIEELPPDQRPEGDPLWVPGYWQWEDDRDDFIWISGIWRLPPPNQSWVPGYWSSSRAGWTWTPGFWLADEIDEVEYLAQPPLSLERGPSSPPPSVNHLWAPGCWLWRTSRFAWRPGYWVEARPDWIWEPSRYVRTPRGCIYVDGYWDRPFERRGVLFAPVYFDAPVYLQPNYHYSPSIVIYIDIIIAHLFVYPSRHHYVYGDYYGEDYSRRGCRPWFDYHDHYDGYNSIYVYERWSHNRDDSRWDDRLREDYRYRLDHAEARPSRTYREQAAAEARAPENMRRELKVAAPLAEISAKGGSRFQFEKIDEDRRASLRGQSKDLAKYRDERVKWESKHERENSDNGKKSSTGMKHFPSDRESAEDEAKNSIRGRRSAEDEAKHSDRDRNPAEDEAKHSTRDRKPATDSSEKESSDKSPENQTDVKRAEKSEPRESAKPDHAERDQSKRADEGKPRASESRDSSSQERVPKGQSKQADEGRPSEQASPPEKPTRERESAAPERIRIPKSPLARKQKGEPGREDNPPARPEMPEPGPDSRSHEAGPKSDSGRDKEGGSDGKNREKRPSGPSQ